VYAAIRKNGNHLKLPAQTHELPFSSAADFPDCYEMDSLPGKTQAKDFILQLRLPLSVLPGAPTERGAALAFYSSSNSKMIIPNIPLHRIRLSGQVSGSLENQKMAANAIIGKKEDEK
jgi:hypothetical protein